MSKMKLSDIVLAAAERVSCLSPNDSYTCSALEEICYRVGGFTLEEEDELIERYTYYFKPPDAVHPVVWLQFQFSDDEEKQEWRLTALCLFAALLAEEGR